MKRDHLYTFALLRDQFQNHLKTKDLEISHLKQKISELSNQLKFVVLSKRYNGNKHEQQQLKQEIEEEEIQVIDIMNSCCFASTLTKTTIDPITKVTTIFPINSSTVMFQQQKENYCSNNDDDDFDHNNNRLLMSRESLSSSSSNNNINIDKQQQQPHKTSSSSLKV